MCPSGAARGERRAEARGLLEAFDLAGIDRWASREPLAWTALQSLQFDGDELVRWRAAEAAGRVAALRAGADLEGVRELLRRTLWLMNDESGGLLPLGPQVVGAVLANVPALRGEFLPVLASFLEEEPFRVGLRWALWRVAIADAGAVAASAADGLAASLSDADPAVRGHAALALASARPASATGLSDDAAPLVVFDPRCGNLRPTTVREVAGGRF